MKQLILIGNGGHAKVIKDIVELSKDYRLAGYLDSAIDQYSEEKGMIYDSLDHIHKYKKSYFFCIAIGNNSVRKRIFETSSIPTHRFATLIHPTAVISKNTEIGQGTVVMANVVINADAKIGKHTIINTGAIIEHDNTIEDYVHISPNATLAGGVTIESGVHVGASATIIPLIHVGHQVIVGAGATVVKDVLPYLTVVGTPAKPKE